ncbi:MAG: hypothetical protein KBH01_05975 [Breznakibacter sp.]|nr:hypothetical protein [Breznakibacter sp.]
MKNRINIFTVFFLLSMVLMGCDENEDHYTEETDLLIDNKKFDIVGGDLFFYRYEKDAQSYDLELKIYTSGIEKNDKGIWVGDGNRISIQMQSDIFEFPESQVLDFSFSKTKQIGTFQGEIAKYVCNDNGEESLSDTKRIIQGRIQIHWEGNYYYISIDCTTEYQKPIKGDLIVFLNYIVQHKGYLLVDDKRYEIIGGDQINFKQTEPETYSTNGEILYGFEIRLYSNGFILKQIPGEDEKEWVGNGSRLAFSIFSMFSQPNGTYTFSEEEIDGKFIDGKFAKFNSYTGEDENHTLRITSGTISISGSENSYTYEINCTYDYNKRIVGYFSGPLNTINDD